mmetsp:Transcript_35280/g.6357  ORF Transcript_35280/g.6357 Transcript_35280/m.6357 type:complete len:105 (-) Transcript_35280:2219-2533(-)
MASEEITTEAHLEFPIPLESVLSVSLSYDNLKVVLEFMMDILRRHETGFKEMGNPKEIKDKLKEKIKDNEKDIDKIKHKLKKTSKRAKKVKKYKKVPDKLKKIK